MMKAWMDKSYHGGGTQPIETALYGCRKVFLEGEITMEVAMGLMKELLLLAGEDNEPISVYVNSPGGDIRAGFLIIDLLQSVPVETNLYCTGMAASMACVILASGKKGHRFILPHSQVMLHEPRLASGIGGASASDVEKTAKSILQVKTDLIEVLTAGTGRSRKEIEASMAYDNYMSPQEAVKFGIADEIVKTVFLR